MRDILFSALVFSTLPYVLRHPWVGALVFAWLSLMVPYNFTWGFAYTFPFVAVVAVCTLLGLFFTKDEVRYRPNTTLVLMILFPLWTTFTSLFALEPELGARRVPEVIKIFFMIHVFAAVILSRKQIEALLWVIAISVGIYGVKGGLYTLAGSSGRVWGPPGNSYLTDNNAFAVAVIMVIPVLYYLRSITTKPWLRHALLISMPVCGIAVLGSYSRGALLGIGAMLTLLWLKSHR
jgi:probable O-glycosylation ligase (exosortase A-associated)